MTEWKMKLQISYDVYAGVVEGENRDWINLHPHMKKPIITSKDGLAQKIRIEAIKIQKRMDAGWKKFIGDMSAINVQGRTFDMERKNELIVKVIINDLEFLACTTTVQILHLPQAVEHLCNGLADSFEDMNLNWDANDFEQLRKNASFTKDLHGEKFSFLKQATYRLGDTSED